MSINENFTMMHYMKFVVLSDILMKSKINMVHVTKTLSELLYKEKPFIDNKMFFDSLVEPNDKLTVIEYYRPDVVELMIKSIRNLVDKNIVCADLIHQERPSINIKTVFDYYLNHRENCSLSHHLTFAVLSDILLKTNGELIDDAEMLLEIYTKSVLNTSHKIVDGIINIISKDNLSLTNGLHYNTDMSVNSNMGFRDIAMIIRPE